MAAVVYPEDEVSRLGVRNETFSPEHSEDRVAHFDLEQGAGQILG